MGRKFSFWVSIYLLAGLFSCAYPISQSVTEKIEKEQPFSDVIKEPAASFGSVVLWGGVVETVQQGAEDTKLLVNQAPLNPEGYPQAESGEGIFLAYTSQFLDPKIYRTGTKVTLAGKIEGMRIKGPGTNDTLLFVRIVEIHAWAQQAERKRGVFSLTPGWEFNQYGPSVKPLVR